MDMRIVALGSGGVGGFYGGLMAAAGSAEVAFVARGAHLAAMREKGLTIERDGGRPLVHVPKVEAAEDAASLGRADLVLIAVKLTDTAAAIEAARPLVERGAAVLSLQNGVTKDDALRAAFGDGAVIGGVAYVGSHIERPGVIAQTGSMQRMVVGEYGPHPSSPRVEALVAAARAAGIDAEVPPDISVAIWQKFVFLSGFSAATAAARLPIGPIRSDSHARAFLRGLIEETVAVGRAKGVALPADAVDVAMARVDTVSPDMTSSLHHDVEAGRKLELPWLAGAVAEMGETLGVPVPCSGAVRAILSPRVRGR